MSRLPPDLVGQYWIRLASPQQAIEPSCKHQIRITWSTEHHPCMGVGPCIQGALNQTPNTTQIATQNMTQPMHEDSLEKLYSPHDNRIQRSPVQRSDSLDSLGSLGCMEIPIAPLTLRRNDSQTRILSTKRKCQVLHQSSVYAAV